MHTHANTPKAYSVVVMSYQICCENSTNGPRTTALNGIAECGRTKGQVPKASATVVSTTS